MLTFGSLFAGIGGIDLGFERAGMQCKWQVEIDSYCQRVLAKHWPNVRRHDDVKTWPQPDTEPVDIICGGFPCQDISYAGKGAGLDGERSGLFFEFARIIREMGPRIVVMENVAALLTRGLDRVLGTLASLGYDAEWHCIPAAAVGAPHIRDRVFILANAISEGLEVEPCERGNDAEEQPPAKRRRSEWGWWEKALADTDGNGIREESNSQKEIRGDESPRRGNSAGCSVVRGIRNSTDGEWWAVEPAVGRVADGVPKRVDRLRGLGNAVVPQVAEFIGRRIVEVFDRD